MEVKVKFEEEEEEEISWFIQYGIYVKNADGDFKVMNEKREEETVQITNKVKLVKKRRRRRHTK